MITAYGDGLHQSLQHKVASFLIDTKEMEGDLYVRIEGKRGEDLTGLYDRSFRFEYVD